MNQWNYSNRNSIKKRATVQQTYNSADEFIKSIKPNFDKKQTIVHQTYDPPGGLIITTTPDELNELNTHQPPTVATTSSITTKSKRQRRKDLKLKWKQKYRPDFQRKIQRPIYHRHVYRKIRLQLADDNICKSDQITINRDKGEVIIDFKSQEDEDKARNIMKINYLSREQYRKRWI